MHFPLFTFAIAIFLPCINARTDLTGCTRTDISLPAGASYAWIVPDTGELCEFLDCGGGRAPPKLNVPGCAAFTGTQVYEPSFMAGFTAAATGGDARAVSTASNAASPATTDLAAVTPTSTARAEETGDGDDVDAGESASLIASTIASAAATTTSTDDVTARRLLRLSPPPASSAPPLRLLPTPLRLVQSPHLFCLRHHLLDQPQRLEVRV
jgi:hypothetical protein